MKMLKIYLNVLEDSFEIPGFERVAAAAAAGSQLRRQRGLAQAASAAQLALGRQSTQEEDFGLQRAERRQRVVEAQRSVDLHLQLQPVANHLHDKYQMKYIFK